MLAQSRVRQLVMIATVVGLAGGICGLLVAVTVAIIDPGRGAASSVSVSVGEVREEMDRKGANVDAEIEALRSPYAQLGST